MIFRMRCNKMIRILRNNENKFLLQSFCRRKLRKRSRICWQNWIKLKRSCKRESTLCQMHFIRHIQNKSSHLSLLPYDRMSDGPRDRHGQTCYVCCLQQGTKIEQSEKCNVPHNPGQKQRDSRKWRVITALQCNFIRRCNPIHFQEDVVNE